MLYTLSRNQLLYDLYVAFECAKRHKTNKEYVRHFTKDLDLNLNKLCDELYERRYKPQPSVCFIITGPKKREIFAANFRDRIVHHLYYNYTYNLYNSTFIEDSYSCRVGKGTHYGIKRLEKHIKSVTDNHKNCGYVLKMDITGYFIHINRLRLLEITNDTFDRMYSHKVCGSNGKYRYHDILDFDFLRYLNEILILLDPTEGCIFRSEWSLWKTLSKLKSLFFTDENCGIPIGNLTSQLFSNVYMNVFDQYVKRVLKCRHYGRYVDDFYIVDCDRKKLLGYVPKIAHFLKDNLKLDINQGKTQIYNTSYGVPFLGAYIKPYRTYASNSTISRIKSKLAEIDCNNVEKNIECSINSMLGVFSHYNSYNVKVNLMNQYENLQVYGWFDEDYSHFNTF